MNHLSNSFKSYSSCLFLIPPGSIDKKTFITANLKVVTKSNKCMYSAVLEIAMSYGLSNCFISYNSCELPSVSIEHQARYHELR